MKTILKKGVIPTVQDYTLACTYCNTIFTYNEEDIAIYGGEQNVGCPLCQTGLNHDNGIVIFK